MQRELKSPTECLVRFRKKWQNDNENDGCSNHERAEVGQFLLFFFPTHFQEQVHLAGTFLPLTRAYLSTQTTVRGSASLAVLLILSQCSLECIA